MGPRAGVLDAPAAWGITTGVGPGAPSPTLTGSGANSMSDALPVPTLAVRDGVTLRPLRSDDAPEMFALIDANRAHLRAWLTWVDHHETSETVATFLAEVERKYEAGTGLELGLTVDGALAGLCGFNSIDGDHRQAEIAYWLPRPQTGRGLVTDAVRALVLYGFGTLCLRRIFLKIATRNEASQGVARRSGSTLEGVEREGMLLNEEFVDVGGLGCWRGSGRGSNRKCRLTLYCRDAEASEREQAMKTTAISSVMQYAIDLEASKAWYADFPGVEASPFDLPMFEWGDGCSLLLASASEGTGRGGTGVWFAVEDVAVGLRGAGRPRLFVQ